MPIAVTTDLVTVNNSDSTTGWLSLGTFATQIASSVDTFIQGTQTVGGRVSQNTAWALALFAAPTNMTTGVHLYAWQKCISWPAADTMPNGGFGVSISSDVTPTITGTSPSNGPTNSKTWYVGGSDNDTTTGWLCYVIDPQSTPNLTIGSPNMTTVNRAGMRAKIVNAVGAGSIKPINIVFDAIRYGTGLTYVGSVAGVAGGFSDILAVDNSVSNSWGIIAFENSVFFGAGKFNFGTTSQTEITNFKSTGRLFIWRNMPVAPAFYEMNIKGTVAFPTTYQLGDFSGSLTSNGVVIKGSGDNTTAQHAVWSLIVGTNTTVNLYGSTFSEMLSATLQSTTTIRGSTFQTFGTITPNGALIDNTSFTTVKTTAPISAVNALVINSPSEMANITNCSFISCNRAIRITAPGTYTFSNISFSANTYDIENTSAGAVIINVSGGGNASTFINTGGGSTTINNTVTLTLTGVINGSEVRIFSRDGSGNSLTELAGIETVSTGSFDYLYSYVPGTMVNIVVFNTGYQYYSLNGFTLPAVNGSIPIQQITDRQFSNPA